MNSSTFDFDKQLAFRFSAIIVYVIVGAASLIHKGPMHVVRITTPIEAFAPFWYMLSAFPVLGMLIADLLSAWFLSHRNCIRSARIARN